MKKYSYGMRLRPYSIGCQPMGNLIEVNDDQTGKFWNILIYSEPLTPEQIHNYDLIDLQKKPGIKAALIDLFKSINKSLLKELDNYTRTESGLPLIKIISLYDEATKDDPQPDFIECIQDLKNSIARPEDYYEIIDFMQETITNQ